jgi:hypothetical protein
MAAFDVAVASYHLVYAAMTSLRRMESLQERPFLVTGYARLVDILVW